MLPVRIVDVGTFLLVLDLIGTFVFALSGASAGLRHRLDLFGVLVLAFAASLAGGIVRDVLIGAVPPVGISDWRYFTAALAGGLVFFVWDSSVVRLRATLLILDAAGLGLFAVAALCGGLTVVVARELGLPNQVGALAGVVVCFALRALAIKRGWKLPVVGEWRRLDEE